jgi:L-idonate 5-dehydrogenase
MRAVVAYAAKDLRIEEVATPHVGPNEVRVRVGVGGICGSDLHYFNHGGFGAVRLREPMILGHEVAATVEEVGAAVTRVKPGDRVAVNPSLPCNACKYCLMGRQNQCLDMRFYGSAMRMPHVHGAFRESLVCAEEQVYPVSDGTSLEMAALAEPLAVCIHAVRQAGDLVGRRVLVTGCGPIGALVLLAARRAGALEIVATDLTDATLQFARKIGADRTINTSSDPDALAPYAQNKGYFDAAFEASGAASALRNCIETVQPGGVIVQLGLGGGDTPVPLQMVTAKELQLRGSFRFHEEFGIAVDYIDKGMIDVKPLISATLPFTQALDAFELANDRSKSMKVQLAF